MSDGQTWTFGKRYSIDSVDSVDVNVKIFRQNGVDIWDVKTVEQETFFFQVIWRKCRFETGENAIQVWAKKTNKAS